MLKGVQIEGRVGYADMTDFHRFHRRGERRGLYAEGIPSGDTCRLNGFSQRKG